MKRFILLVVLLLGVQALYAQRSYEHYPKTELSLSYSIYPRVAAEQFLDAHYQAITGGFRSETGYQGNQVHSTGLITGEIAFKLKNWLTVGVQLGGGCIGGRPLALQRRDHLHCLGCQRDDPLARIASKAYMVKGETLTEWEFD